MLSLSVSCWEVFIWQGIGILLDGLLELALALRFLCKNACSTELYCDNFCSSVRRSAYAWQGSDVIYFRENVGLLGLTRVGSRRVVQLSAAFMIFFSILGWYYLRHERIIACMVPLFSAWCGEPLRQERFEPARAKLVNHEQDFLMCKIF